LNTRWDEKLQAELEAKGLDECEQQFKTTAPLRLVKKNDTINRRAKNPDRRLPLDGNKGAQQADKSMTGRAVAGLPDLEYDPDSVTSVCSNAGSTAGTQWLDTGCSFVPAPEATFIKEPESMGWFSRLLGGSHRRHSDLIKD
jgi:hypothetical protein